jgi:hypothetical protein
MAIICYDAIPGFSVTKPRKIVPPEIDAALRAEFEDAI